jgi:hypothetical protein
LAGEASLQNLRSGIGGKAKEGVVYQESSKTACLDPSSLVYKQKSTILRHFYCIIITEEQLSTCPDVEREARPRARARPGLAGLDCSSL